MENNETEVINIGASAYRLYSWKKDIWTKKDEMEYKRQKDRQIIPHIRHFFTHAKFLENKIYTKIYTVNCQFTQLIANLHSK